MSSKFDPKLPHVIVFADPKSVTPDNPHGVQVAKSANIPDHELAIMLLGLGSAKIAEIMHNAKKFSEKVVLADGSPAPLPPTESAKAE